MCAIEESDTDTLPGGLRDAQTHGFWDLLMDRTVSSNLYLTWILRTGWIEKSGENKKERWWSVTDSSGKVSIHLIAKKQKIDELTPNPRSKLTQTSNQSSSDDDDDEGDSTSESDEEEIPKEQLQFSKQPMISETTKKQISMEKRQVSKQPMIPETIKEQSLGNQTVLMIVQGLQNQVTGLQNQVTELTTKINSLIEVVGPMTKYVKQLEAKSKRKEHVFCKRKIDVVTQTHQEKHSPTEAKEKTECESQDKTERQESKEEKVVFLEELLPASTARGTCRACGRKCSNKAQSCDSVPMVDGKKRKRSLCKNRIEYFQSIQKKNSRN